MSTGTKQMIIDDLEIINHIKSMPDRSEPWHDRRYLLSLQSVLPLLKPEYSVLTIGGKSIFEDLLTKYSGIQIEGTGFDLRYPFQIPSESYDFILCMEVLEHVTDTPSTDIGTIATFTGSGIRNVMSECYRILKPNGVMFLTTPNVCGPQQIYNILLNVHPYRYHPHNRELSFDDVKEYISESKFEIENVERPHVWNTDVFARLKELEGVELPAEVFERGDIIFITIQKGGECPLTSTPTNDQTPTNSSTS